MKVLAHEAVRKSRSVKAIEVVACDLKQLSTINGILEDWRTPIAARGRVIQRPFEFDAKGTGHIKCAGGGEAKSKT